VKSFLTGLKYGTPEQNVGSNWTSGDDQGLVCLICRTERSGGTWYGSVTDLRGAIVPGLFMVTLDELKNFQVETFVSKQRRVKVAPARPLRQRIQTKKEEERRAKPRLGTKRVTVSLFAHECGHAFGLEDEYGDGRGASLPASKVAAMANKLNVQARAAVLDGTQIVLDRLRWRWPRIASASYVKTAPKKDDDFSATVEVSPGSFVVQKGSTVQLRWRDLHKHRGRPQAKNLYSAQFKVTEVTWYLSEGYASVKFEMPRTDGQRVKLPDLSHWTVGDLVLAPVLKADGTGRLYLTAPQVERAMTGTEKDKPLASYSGGGDTRSKVMTPTLMPGSFWKRAKGRRRPPLRATLIGLYEGGYRYDKGVFRPSGVCIMRVEWGTRFGLYRFCQVCQYILVDKIDPTRHGDLDYDYAKVYPEP
jgi:hypothetical protein